MSTPINDGGPAFPFAVQHLQSSYAIPMKGMSLRDWFAGQALAGLCANTGVILGHHKLNEHPADCQESISTAAFSIADAMLAAREVKP